MALSAAWMLWLEPPRIRGKATQASTSTAIVPAKRVKPVQVARFLKAAGSLAGLGLGSSEGLIGSCLLTCSWSDMSNPSSSTIIFDLFYTNGATIRKTASHSMPVKVLRVSARVIWRAWA